MLTTDEFFAWANRNGLSEVAIATIVRARTSDPTRNVTNAAGNMCGKFPSSKMAHSVQWESWTGERALVLLWEFDPSCLEMWDQSINLKISYTLPNGRRSGTWTTTDYLVLMVDGATIVDYKTSEELRTLTVEQPYRWVQTGPASWDQPPAREAAKALGLGYKVISDHDIPHTLLRNIDFLRPRLLRSFRIPEDVTVKVKQALNGEHRISLTEAILFAENADYIYDGHFRGHWHLDLQNEVLAFPDNSWLYADFRSASMYNALNKAAVANVHATTDPNLIEDGSMLLWGKSFFYLISRTEKSVFLRSDANPLITLTRKEFSELVTSEVIVPCRNSEVVTKSGLNILLVATPEAVDDAIERMNVMEAHFRGTKVSELGVPKRTFYEWLERYRTAEQNYGNGFIGLIDRHDLKGNRTIRTSDAELDCLQKAFKWLHAPNPREAAQGYAVYVSYCADDVVIPRSLKSFNDAWNSRDQYEAKLDREGKRAAYELKPPKHTGGEHTDQGPPEGDSPFSLVHIDHVQSNIFCRRQNGIETLAKPWFSIAIDAFTRLVLALWVSFLAPSHASVMMCLRDIVRRHGRLPLTVITDGGKDFWAEIVAKFMASKGCEHALRPAGEPRYGLPIERLNLNLDHHLSKVLYGGNTVLRNPRNSSRTHDPRTLARFTIEQLADKASWLLFEHYPDRFHNGIQSTPNDKAKSASVLQGNSWGREWSFDEQLIFQTLALPHKHGGLVRQRDGIALNGHNYYADALVGKGDFKISDKPLYDPEDPTYIYARVDKQWTRCRMIDSQLRRLPPEGHRRYYLSERIFLSKASSHKKKTHASLASLGRFYRDADAEFNLDSDIDASPENGAAQNKTTNTNQSEKLHSNDDSHHREDSADERSIKPAPISRRSQA